MAELRRIYETTAENVHKIVHIFSLIYEITAKLQWHHERPTTNPSTQAPSSGAINPPPEPTIVAQ